MLSSYRRAPVVACALLAALFPAPSAPARGGSCWSWSHDEKKLARMTNGTRARRDVGPLSLDPELSKVARVHAREMSRRGLHHTPSATLQRRVTRWTRLGENVGVGSSVRAVQQAFMRSSDHRDNVLTRGFGHFGVGVHRADGRVWVTVTFSAGRNPGTTLKMPC